MTVLMSSNSMFLYKKLLKSWTTISSWRSQKEQNLGLLSWPQSQTSETTAGHSTCGVLLVVTEMLNPLHNLKGDHLKQTTNNRGNTYFVTDSVWELLDVPSYIVLTRMPSWIFSSHFHIKKRTSFKSRFRTLMWFWPCIVVNMWK